MKHGLLALAVLVLLTAHDLRAEVALGSGFSCEGGLILKAGKEVTYTKAKSNLKKTIAKLKDKLKTAPKRKKPGIKAKIDEAKAAKTLITACISGGLDPSGVDPLFSSLASGSGRYSGNYNGVVAGIVPISGAVDVLFELNGTVFSATLGLSGNLGSTLNAQPLAFQKDVGGIGFPAQFLLSGTFLGDVILSIDASGHLTITNSNSSTGAVTFEGTFGGANVNSTLGGSYNGISFSGGANLTRVP